MPDISIVIPTLNAGTLFGDLLGRLKTQQGARPFELLVIDSGSSDQTCELARQHQAKLIEIPREEFNHGLTRNRAIEAAVGELVVLLTQDAIPADDHMLAALTKPFEDPEVAGVFARQIPRPEADALVARNINCWITGSTRRRIVQITDRRAYERMRPAERHRLCVFDNVCSAIRGSVWKQIPFTACEFGEDLDWAKRVLEAGYKIAYEPDAAVIHSHDRPIDYEYKRTYMCHRTLYRLFGLETVPAYRSAVRSIASGIVQDSLYVLRHQPGLKRKLALLAKIPGLVQSSVLGQYYGARDERSQRGIRQEGV